MLCEIVSEARLKWSGQNCVSLHDCFSFLGAEAAQFLPVSISYFLKTQMCELELECACIPPVHGVDKTKAFLPESVEGCDGVGEIEGIFVRKC